jgi:hypothetical protein
MTEYRKGQRVKVEFEGTVACVFQDGIHLGVYQDGAISMGSGISVLIPATSITLLDPPDWPPQEGDIWEAEGREYFVRANADYDCKDRTVQVREDGRLVYRLDDFKALNPTPVRRRG